MEREGEAIELIASTLQKPVQKTTKTDLTKSFKMVFLKWIMKLLDGGEKYSAVNAYSKYSWIINDEDKKSHGYGT